MDRKEDAVLQLGIIAELEESLVVNAGIRWQGTGRREKHRVLFSPSLSPVDDVGKSARPVACCSSKSLFPSVSPLDAADKSPTSLNGIRHQAPIRAG